MPLSKLLRFRESKFPSSDELETRGVRTEKVIQDLTENPMARVRIPEAPVPSADAEESQIRIAPRIVEPRQSTEQMQKIIEHIFDDRLKQFTKELEPVKKLEDDIAKLSRQIDTRFEMLSKQIETSQTNFEAKVSEHDQLMNDLSVEIKALKRVFDNIPPTFTDSIRELRSLLENKK